ncbi:MAG: SAM-dependent methyltransferase [Tissierellales bacterium]|nr:SAM-dependent methyltransferase [Tissierellales bacterium]
MKLSKRLQSLINYVPQNSIVADIGTDHGYVPCALIENGISKYVIATDVSQNSLSKTTELIDTKLFKDKITTRVGNGLEPIKPFEVDTVIIAGMGGTLISEILNQNLKKADTYINFILQPMVASTELRIFLNNNGFEIIDEDLVEEDDFIYEIIFAKRGLEFIGDDIYFEISNKLINKKHHLLEKFISKKIEQCIDVKKELEDHLYSQKANERYDEIEHKILKYKEVLKCL